MKGVVADESAVKLPPLRYSENCAPKSYLAGMCEDDWTFSSIWEKEGNGRYTLGGLPFVVVAVEGKRVWNREELRRVEKLSQHKLREIGQENALRLRRVP